MTRIAIVAASEQLRASLAQALEASDDFEVVAVGASVAEVKQSADVILVARASDASAANQPGGRNLASETVLTTRERQVLALVADGLGNKQIGARLGISTNTVKTHLELLFEKLNVSTRAEAVASGVRRGLLLI